MNWTVPALLLSLSAPAFANGRTVVRGDCSDGSVWKMEAVRAAGGRVEVEFEIETWVSGETWDVTMWQNGASFFSGSRVTRGADGTFWIERVRPNRAGDDQFEAVAVNLVTGESCEGELLWTR
jgi:hypothetical protein